MAYNPMDKWREENERFKTYREAARERRMDNIRAHAEDYRPDERKMAADYFAAKEREEEADRQHWDRQSHDKAMVAAAGEAERIKGENAKAEFERQYGVGDAGIAAWKAERDAQRAMELDREKWRGSEAARINGEYGVKTAEIGAKNREKVAQIEGEWGVKKQTEANEGARIAAESQERIRQQQEKNKMDIAQMRVNGKLSSEGMKKGREIVKGYIAQGMTGSKLVRKLIDSGYSDEEIDEMMGRENKEPETQQKTAAVQRPGINRFMV